MSTWTGVRCEPLFWGILAQAPAPRFGAAYFCSEKFLEILGPSTWREHYACGCGSACFSWVRVRLARMSHSGSDLRITNGYPANDSWVLVAAASCCVALGASIFVWLLVMF